MDNPLLASPAVAPLPAFERIQPQHAEAALDAVLAENRAELDALLTVAGRADWVPSWEGLIEPLEEMTDRISRVWGPVSHLFGVTSTTEWRKAYNACLPKITVYSLELSQNENLLRAYERLAASPAFATFSAARKKVVADAQRDFRLSGIGLPAAEKARFTAIELRLSELHSKFEENLIDSVQAYSKHVTDEAALRGMTPQGKELAREKARAKGLEGFVIALDFPSYDAVVSYADDRALRRELYEAYGTRASDQGPLAGKFDNTPLMDEIMALRHEEAKLLGYANFADMSLVTKNEITTDLEPILAMNARLESYPLPLIAAVEGVAFGFGFGLATLCDVTVVGEGATFALTELAHGIPPLIVLSYFFRFVPYKVGLDLALTGRELDAEAALGLGLATSVCATGSALAAARKTADHIAATDPEAVRLLRRFARDQAALANPVAATYGADQIATLLASRTH